MLWSTTHAIHLLLLVVVFDESRSHHVDSMFPLDFIAVVQQKRLIPCKLLLNRLNGNFINCLSYLESFYGLYELLCYGEDILREESPFGLGVNKSVLCILLLPL